MSAGKGSRPRNNFSKSFRDGYDAVCWDFDKKHLRCRGQELNRKHFPGLYRALKKLKTK